jgi:A/G-specific adenine glycosylase
VQRPPRGVWAGLWSLPEEVESADACVPRWPPAGRARAGRLPAIEHVLTHLDWRLEPWTLELPLRLAAAGCAPWPLPRAAAVAREAALPAGRWVALDEALQLGLPAPVRKLLQASR